ncbi:MAG: hypothetical protein U9N13_06610 [Euryarchaeota archaeon]|nr:hypothetical protein [Euryarchaeota archaeon]
MLGVAAANGIEGDPLSDHEEVLFCDIQDNVDTYIEKLDRMPDTCQKLIENEDILIIIDMNDGDTVRVKVITRNAQLAEFEIIESASQMEPTTVVRTDENTIRSIVYASNGRQAFNRCVMALNNDCIEVEVQGFFKKATFWAMKNSLEILT